MTKKFATDLKNRNIYILYIIIYYRFIKNIYMCFLFSYKYIALDIYRLKSITKLPTLKFTNFDRVE